MTKLRRWPLVVAIIALVFSLAACGESPPKDTEARVDRASSSIGDTRKTLDQQEAAVK